jgi:hypothetical protein
MKERQILMKAPMVRALLAGTKTQTRRVIKLPHGADVVVSNGKVWKPAKVDYAGYVDCPHGQPGDRLWVRETWQFADWTDDGTPWVGYAADGTTRLCQTPNEKRESRLNDIWTELSAPENYNIDGKAADRRWRPSIYMPRWASRITLEITGVRVERLQKITPAECVYEGYVSPEGTRYAQDELASLDWYRDLWGSINGPGSWDKNPWVWVIEFRRLEPA